MKRLLIISLVANLALLALVAWRKPRTGALPTREIRSEPELSTAAVQQRRVHRTAPTKIVTSWSRIENRDVRAFMANLRAIGCPEATIRDIVTLRVCRRYRERLLEFETELALKRANNSFRDNAEIQMVRNQQQVLRDGMISELESLLGETWPGISSSMFGNPVADDTLYGTLSAERRAQLREIGTQFRIAMDELDRKQIIEGLEKDDVANYRTLLRQEREALAAVLSPQELEEYLYRSSPAAEYVRRNLPPAKSEGEFRMMVKLALEMEMSNTLDSPSKRFGMASDNDDVDLEARKRRGEYAQRLKELLGEDRIAEQQAEAKVRADAETKARGEQEKQRMRQELTGMAAEVGVSADVAGRFFDRLKDAEAALKKKFDDMEKKLSGTPEEKRKQMEAAIKAELNAMAIETMGEKGPSVVERMMKSGK